MYNDVYTGDMKFTTVTHRTMGTWMLFALAGALLLFFATYRLSEAPHIWYDEGYYTQTAQNFMLSGQQVLQVAPGEFTSASTITGGYPLIVPVALSYQLFGVGVLSGRAVMVMFIVSFFLATVYLITLLFGTRFALWSAFLIASFPMLYGNGKSVLGEVPGLFFFVVALIALVYLERSGYRSLSAYGVSALAAGLCIATKPIFILLLPALAIVWFLYRKSVPIRWGGVVLATLVFIATMVPWFLLQFGTHDTLANVLTFYTNPYEVTDLTTNVLANLLLFVTDVTPFYALAVFALWGCAMFVRRRAGESVSSAETVGFIFSGLVMLAFLRMPGWYRYLFPAIMVGLLFVSHALWRMEEWVRERIGIPRIARVLPWLVLSLLIVAQCYQTANASFVAAYYSSHMTRDLTAALNSLPPNASIFVYNAPEAVILLPSLNYYQYIKPHPTIGILGTDALQAIANGTVDYILLNTGTVPDVDMSKYKPVQNFSRYTILEKQ
jgi:4-amino-4-deoxy-L-arabinose transferase-like glycosyltransferase